MAAFDRSASSASGAAGRDRDVDEHRSGRSLAVLPLAAPVLAAEASAVPLLLAEVSAVAVALAAAGLVAAHRFGLVRRLRTTPEQRAVERALADPASTTDEDLDALLAAADALATAEASADVDAEALRRAINAIRETDPEPIGDRADRFAAHLRHPAAPVRVAASVALAEVARERPGRVWPHADAFEALLADEDPTVRQNAVWCFRWLAREHAADLGRVAPTVLGRADDPNPDVRANVVTFSTEFAHDAPAVAVAVPGLEARLRVLATDDALDREVRHDALVTADYVKSLRQDPAVTPARDAGVGIEGPPSVGDAVDLLVAEATEDDDGPLVRGAVAGVDVVVRDPPSDPAPMDRLRVEVVDTDADGAGLEAAVAETPA